VIVYGYKTVNKVMGQVQQPCPRCQRQAAQTIVRSRRWFTLFWIKTFPITKKTIMRCSACGSQSQIDNKQADAWFGQPQAMAGGMPPQQLQ
jgi:predicted RNA-binding Zn-ribbon protein involved in translation (DUF1610 family)